jgi:6-phosphogluconolactonase
MNRLRLTRRGLLKLGGAAALTTAAGGAAVADPAAPAFWFGSYTSAGGPGIIRGHLDTATGRPVAEQSTAAVKEASWLAAGPSGGIRYAVSEQNAGTVDALAPDLTVLSTTPTGAGPAHVAVHPRGGFLFVSLYNGGAVVTHPIAADGRVGAATDIRRQSIGGRQSHAHQVVVDPSGTRVLAVDLGVDTVFSYALDSRGRLTEVSRTTLTRGSGPRHLAFHPNGTVAYVLNELNSTVTVCAWTDGVLRPGQILPAAPQTGVANAPAEVVVSADGRFVYVSNRGTDTVGVFATSANGSTLSRIAAPSCGGSWPRHLALAPAGNRLYVANQRSGTVTWLPIDPATGVPGPAAGSFAVPGVANILF